MRVFAQKIEYNTPKQSMINLSDQLPSEEDIAHGLKVKIECEIGIAQESSRVSKLADLIVTTVGFDQGDLNLKPQFSSDFMSFQALSKEIESTCLMQCDESD
jgi:hypothetical protein